MASYCKGADDTNIIFVAVNKMFKILASLDRIENQIYVQNLRYRASKADVVEQMSAFEEKLNSLHRQQLLYLMQERLPEPYQKTRRLRQN